MSRKTTAAAAGKRAREGGGMDKDHTEQIYDNITKPLALYIKIVNKTLNIRAGDMA